jgi:hypothetical protein
MKKTILILAALIVLPLLVERVEACSCAYGETVCDAYQKASAVFIGIPLSEAPASSQHEVYALGKGKETVTWQEKLFRFSIEESFKGIGGTEIEVQTGLGGGDCGYAFQKGERYLIYAYRDSKTNRFHTSICTRTSMFSRASEDVDFLRGLPNSTTQTRVSGTIIQYTNERDQRGYQKSQYMSGVKVLIIGEDKSFETTTNKEGMYQIVGLPPGRYKVKAELSADLLNEEKEIIVPVAGCATLTIYTQTDGRVSGKIMDHQGQIVEGARVNLIPVDTAKDKSSSSIAARIHIEKTDKEGKYHFKEIPPGRYYLGINLDEQPRGDSPYPRTYFPGILDRDKATVIVLGEGEKVTGYNIQLPPALAVTTIEGVFVWSDGRPVNPGRVSFTSSAEKGGKFYGGGEVDAQGRFRFDSLNGKECWIHGSTYSTVNGTMQFVNIEPIKILVEDGMQPLKLIAPVPPKPNDETKKKKEP